MQFLITLIIGTIAVVAGAYLLPGVTVDGFLAALVTAIVVGLFNAILKPVLIVLTLPITVLTLGSFTLVINALLILLASWVVEGFSVENFWWALLFSVLLGIFNGFLGRLGRQRSAPVASSDRQPPIDAPSRRLDDRT